MSNKFEEFLEFCRTSSDLEKIDIAIRRQFNIIKESGKLPEPKKNELIKKILQAASSNKLRDVKEYALESYKHIFKPEIKKFEGKKEHKKTEKPKEFHDEKWEKDSLKEHLDKKIVDVKKLPSKPFILIYEEMEKKLPDQIYDETQEEEKTVDGKVKLKVKSTGKIDYFDEKVAKVLLEKGAAVKYKERKRLREESFEEKWQRFYGQAEMWKNDALSGNLHSLELLVALLANKFPVVKGKGTLKSKAAEDVLSEYDKSDLPYLLAKLLTKEHKLKAVDPKNIAQKSKAEVLRDHFEKEVKAVLEKRIPIVFRKRMVDIYEERLVKKSRLFTAQTELNALTKPAHSDDYEVDQKLVDELTSKKEELEKDVNRLDNEMEQIDMDVKKEMASIEELRGQHPSDNRILKELLDIYEINFFQKKEDYLSSKKVEKEKTEGYFSSTDDILNHYKKFFRDEEIDQNKEPSEIKVEAEKMIENMIKFVKDPEQRFKYFLEIYGNASSELAANAIIDAVGDIMEIKQGVATLKTFDENTFQQFFEELAMYLYQTIKEGKGSSRVHAYAALGKIGRLHKYEVEKLWYEEWLRAYKYESDQLAKDPFNDDVIEAYVIGAKRLEAVGTKLYKMKKKVLHNEILKQIQLAKEKNNKMLEQFYRKMANEI